MQYGTVTIWLARFVSETIDVSLCSTAGSICHNEATAFENNGAEGDGITGTSRGAAVSNHRSNIM